MELSFQEALLPSGKIIGEIMQPALFKFAAAVKSKEIVAFYFPGNISDNISALAFFPAVNHRV